MGLPSYLVLELVEEQKASLAPRDRVAAIQTVLNRRLRRIVDQYAGKRLSYREAVQQAERALQVTQHQILTVAQAKANRALVPLKIRRQLNPAPPLPNDASALLASDASRRLGDFMQVLTDTGTHNDPNTAGYYATDDGLQNRLGAIAHNACWNDYNRGTVNLTDRQLQAMVGMGLFIGPGGTPSSLVSSEPPSDLPGEGTGVNGSWDLIYIWRTHPEESRTGPCDYCDSQNGVVFTQDAAAVADIPHHPNCACELDPELREI